MDAVKESVRSYWDSQAGGFDHEFGHGLRDRRHKEIWMNILQRNLSSDRPLKILDAGCGTGFLSLLLSELGHEVTGLDFSTEMLAVARKKAEERNMSIGFHQGDAENPPFPPESYDYVICRHLIWTLPYPGQALENWKGLLRPGGGLVLVEGHWKQPGLAAKARRWLALAVQMVEQRKLPENWEKGYVRNTADLPLFGGRPSNVLSDLLKEAGFEQVWKDGLEDLLENERESAPLSYRIGWAHLKERRFLLKVIK